MDDVVSEHKRELEQLGDPPRFDIRMYPLLGEDRPATAVLIPATSLQHRRVVEEIGKQFRRELRFDGAPFDADDETAAGVLISSRRFLTTFPIAAGAAGFERDTNRWIMNWVWIHPYERGTGLFEQAWTELEEMYGTFFIEGPYSPAMESFIQRRGIHPDRHDPLG